jgi:hypothetical protein
VILRLRQCVAPPHPLAQSQKEAAVGPPLSFLLYLPTLRRYIDRRRS